MKWFKKLASVEGEQNLIIFVLAVKNVLHIKPLSLKSILVWRF